MEAILYVILKCTRQVVIDLYIFFMFITTVHKNEEWGIQMINVYTSESDVHQNK